MIHQIMLLCPLFDDLSFILSAAVCACLYAGIEYKWFLNESSAKYQLCEAPNVQFQLFFWDIGTEKPIQFHDYYWGCSCVQCSL